MRGYLKLFLLLFLLCNIGTAWAVGEGETCDATYRCDTDLYCNAFGKCAQCPTEYQNSIHGNNNDITGCYKICDTKNATLGKKEPKKPTIHYDSNNSDQQCEYKEIECVDNAIKKDENSCQCQEHYIETTSSGTTLCTGKCYTLTLVKNLTNVAESPSTLYVKYGDGFYKGYMCSGTKLDPDTTAEANSTYGWLIPKYTWWQDFKGYSTEQAGGTFRFGSTGKPTIGTSATTFEDNTTLYGQWNKKQYKINYFDGTTKITSLDEQKCDIKELDVTEPEGLDTCRAKKIDAGKNGMEIIGWSETPNNSTVSIEFNEIIPASASEINLYAVWGKCSAGYYCDTARNPCPAGATSNAGASAQTQCYISSATQFRDKLTGEGSFTLPIGTIYYK